MMTASLWNAGYPTTVSLYFNCVLYLFLMVVANRAVARLAPKRAMSSGDILTVYVGLAVASAINGLDMLQLIGSLIAGPHTLATPENDWLGTFIGHIPSWFVVTDRTALTNYSQGESSFYAPEHIRAWAVPAFAWGVFTVFLVVMMLGMTLILSSRWVAEERLSYPVIQLPLAMTQERFFSQPLMWIGFALGAVVATVNGLHFFYPIIPSIGRPVNLGVLFTEKPLNAIGWLPVAAHPFAVGLGFLIPLELSFSCWFFYFFWKFERVLAAMSGIRTPGFPFVDEQTTGAYLAFAVVGLWVARRHIRRAFGRNAEPTSRGGAILFTIGIAGLVGFCLRAGLSVGAVALFFSLYALLSVAIGRLRAELGAPVHDLHFAGPERMMVSVFGSRFFRPKDLTILSFFFFFNRAYRSHPMPTILEGFKIGERVGTSPSRLTIAVLVAIVWATASAFGAHLQSAYHFGTSARFWPAYETFNRLTGWLGTPTPPDVRYMAAYGFGACVVFALTAIRTRFLWFPFHPVGFVVSSSWGMNPFWFSIFVSWAIKLTLLRMGGIGLYRRGIPFFLGAVLGEFLADSGSSIAGTLLRVPTYLWYG
jgi:hypothetical protein